MKSLSETHYNPDFIHHQKKIDGSAIRELVFGMEDGMVSTMGAVTGIAIGSDVQSIVIMAGLVIVSVESISMAVGSYLSNKSERSIDERVIEEEKSEIKSYPKEEEEELVEIYIRDGWPEDLAKKMAHEAAGNKKLFLNEMMHHELKVIPEKIASPVKNAFIMGISYIFGGAIPVVPYFVLPINTALSVSVVLTFVGLFVLGSFTSKYSKRKWWRVGLEMVILAGVAALVGYLVGEWLR